MLSFFQTIVRKNASEYYMTQYINRLQDNARMAEIPSPLVQELRGGYKSGQKI